MARETAELLGATLESGFYLIGIYVGNDYRSFALMARKTSFGRHWILALAYL